MCHGFKQFSELNPECKKKKNKQVYTFTYILKLSAILDIVLMLKEKYTLKHINVKTIKHMDISSWNCIAPRTCLYIRRCNKYNTLYWVSKHLLAVWNLTNTQRRPALILVDVGRCEK